MNRDEFEQRGPWYAGITAGQWLVLAIASAGWVFDVYEAQLFTIFKTPMLKELLGGSNPDLEWHAYVAFALFLVGGAVGGLGFGILGDRIGRVRVMSLTILSYSVFSALTFFARTVWQVDALRFLVALGTGGEWAIAAALVSETFPVRARANASGIFHASSVLGVALASWTGMVLNEPGQWRWGFLLGLAPALLVLWIRTSLSEPERWQAVKLEVELGAKEDELVLSGRELGSVAELLGDRRWRSRALLGLALASVGLATYWGIFASGPDLVREVLGPGVSDAERQAASSWAYLLMNFTGGLFGLLAFAPIASWKGRRFAFVLYHLGALVLVPITFLGARTYEQTLWLLPAMAFFVVGMHAGYAIYFPELFPTRLRATGSSFCFNLGRVVGAAILLVRGALGARLGLRHAVVGVAGLFLAGLVLLAFAPETRGQNLPE
jgi:MFS family permease